MDQQDAVVIGASGGIGSATATALEERNRAVIALSRHSEPALDLIDEQSIAAAAHSLAMRGIEPDLVIVATGLLHGNGVTPEKSLRELSPEQLIRSYQVNAIGPALVAKHFLPIMPRDRRAVLAALSARVGSISDNRLGGWHSYRASKAALNMLIRNIAIEWQRKNPLAIIVGLHPGTVETRLSAPYKGNAQQTRLAPNDAARRLLDVIEGLNAEHSGQLLSYSAEVIAP